MLSWCYTLLDTSANCLPSQNPPLHNSCWDSLDFLPMYTTMWIHRLFTLGINDCFYLLLSKLYWRCTAKSCKHQCVWRGGEMLCFLILCQPDTSYSPLDSQLWKCSHKIGLLISLQCIFLINYQCGSTQLMEDGATPKEGMQENKQAEQTMREKPETPLLHGLLESKQCT